MYLLFASHSILKTALWKILGTSLVIQWLRLFTSTAGGAGSIPGQGTKILHAVQHGQEIKRKKKKKKERKEKKNLDEAIK